jgi:hypothetical protein
MHGLLGMARISVRLTRNGSQDPNLNATRRRHNLIDTQTRLGSGKNRETAGMEVTQALESAAEVEKTRTIFRVEPMLKESMRQRGISPVIPQMMARFSQVEMWHVNDDANEYLFMSLENKRVASFQPAVEAVSMVPLGDNQNFR